jgi:hypothetical protein
MKDIILNVLKEQDDSHMMDAPIEWMRNEVENYYKHKNINLNQYDTAYYKINNIDEDGIHYNLLFVDEKSHYTIAVGMTGISRGGTSVDLVWNTDENIDVSGLGGIDPELGMEDYSDFERYPRKINFPLSDYQKRLSKTMSSLTDNMYQSFDDYRNVVGQLVEMLKERNKTVRDYKTKLGIRDKQEEDKIMRQIMSIERLLKKDVK